MLYYGLIKQSTGEDWLDAKLSLSTANPSIGGSVPELDVQLLKFKQPVTIMPKRNMRRGYNERSKNTSYMTTIGFEDIGYVQFSSLRSNPAHVVLLTLKVVCF